MAYISQDEKKALAPAIKAILKKYKVKGTLSIKHYSTLVISIKSGEIDFFDALHKGEPIEAARRDYINVNEYWIAEHYSGVARDFLLEIKAAMEGPDFFNETDIQSDYFHRSHYIDIKIGSYSKAYALAA